MQGTHNWAENLNKTFEEHSYYKSCANPQIQSKVYDNELTLTSTWTDNVLGASLTLENKYLAKLQLGSNYKIKDLGKAKFILRMQINRNTKEDIILSQQAYCKCLLKCFNMSSCLPTSTSLSPSTILSTEDCLVTPDKVNKIKKTPF